MVDETVRAGAGHRTEVFVWLGLALLLGALSALVLIPQAQHLRSLRDGVRANATMHTRGTCALGQCSVAFEAQDRTVVAALPPGSSGSKYPVGAHLTVRYRADDPQTVAAAADVEGGGATLLAASTGAGAVLFLLLPVMKTVARARRRRAASSAVG
ncbi:hypothetical protein HET69_37325 [Streptomyces sp. CJ_13]|uniref:DUF3592 domain-containing protein n=1 Tax=unclassified Streptomyces TaxID=2593676 RepID=UPI000F3A9DD5|nr:MULTISPECIES: DUF3592 domain-containing protein [unclassified Streptomyces]AYV32503.1 hypothetical protein EES41_37710 [Streptomyces sp. ADI95-16]MBT1189497.1 hypothetical protein [Streptomyces sp. CJ_13]